MHEIILAEDNPRDRQFLGSLLNGFAIVEAVDGGEALRLARKRNDPWIVSDLQMPTMNGIDLARELWRTSPTARIVFWSQHNDEMYVRSLAKIIPPETVYGYVLKDNPAGILSKAIHAVFLEDQCWIDPKLRPIQARVQRHENALTDAEYEVLIDIALGLTDNMIARRRYLSRRGAQSRLKSLYSKLGIDREQFIEEKTGEALNMRARAVAIALQRGLINPHELKTEEDKLQKWLDAARKSSA
jgi:DNA-binding NarL/FixJ family response regulator